jgi:hypothetical protein
MGLVATMSALVLGLLVTSVKGAYDTRRGEVIQMAAKVAYIDRVLKAYGPEADEVRRQFREMVEEDIRRLWPRVDDIPAQFRPNEEGKDSVFIADQLQQLAPRDDTQRILKTQATTLVMEFGQLRSMLTAQSVASISRPMRFRSALQAGLKNPGNSDPDSVLAPLLRYHCPLAACGTVPSGGKQKHRLP